MDINILSSLDSKKTFVHINNIFRKKLFEKVSGKPLTKLALELGIPLKNLSRYRNGSRSMPLNIFLLLVKKSGIDLKYFQRKIKLKSNDNSNFVIIGPYLTIDTDWVYISSLINGDGHITKNLWCITFVNKERALIDYFKEFFLKAGIPESSIYLYDKRSDALFLTIRSKILAQILHNIFNVSIGKKGEIFVPNFIFGSPALIAAAIRGFFDTEGSVQFGTKNNPINPRKISLTSTSKIYLNSMKDFLSFLSIESTLTREFGSRRPIYRLHIYHYNNLNNFYKIIKPLHPKKNYKLKNLLYSYNARRVIEGSMIAKILFSIKNGNTKRSEIASDLEFSSARLVHHLKWLIKNNFIKISRKVSTNKGGFYKYALTQKGSTFLKK